MTHYCLRCYRELRPAPANPAGATGGKEEVEAACPHCGLQYDPLDEQTFVSFDILSPWAAYLLAFLVLLFGGGCFLVSTNYNEGVGWAIVLGLPICAGAVLGYSSNPGRFRAWQKVIIGLMLFCGFLIVASFLGGVGLGPFCIVMLCIVFILPFFFGDWIGYMIRRSDERKQRGWPWKWMKIVIFLLLPFGLDAIERLVPRDEDLAFVETQAVFSASMERSWNSIVFYEQIEHEPPLLLRLALPRPVGATGGKAEVGDTSRCVYENGYLVKQITRREEGRLLGFRVIEQKLHFEHDLEIREGSFRIEPGPGPGTTLVTLTTTYRRLTYPAFIWQPAETLVLHTLHGHVLEGMRANAERELAVDPAATAPEAIGRARSMER
ncbi:MAG: hypothetical protein OSB83_09960 [Planctomycetota bacterium]|nr:hypothetical protein [Planctomycetota bacterium]